ncbi:TIGR03790 family protein [Verrucomicrobiota bacterium]
METGWTRSLLLAVTMLLAPGSLFALGPHELLVLYNTESAGSVRVAREFAAARQVPGSNLVGLELPRKATESPSTISRRVFTRLIWEPATLAVAERGIGDHILAWVYSVDFPIRIEGNPPISIQGLTFLRDVPPGPEEARTGTYASPLFGGPDSRGWEGHHSQSFDVLADWLRDDMPLPSMMLGYVGERGNEPREVLECVRRGVSSDGTYPTGTVYFVTGDDVRARCRQWQYPLVARELGTMGVKAVVGPDFPEGATDVLGLMAGAAFVRPGRCKSYLPGAMAEHLTSAAAVFHNPHQTKLTAWIRAGATASAGTVTEPRSIWSKFPNARFFVHYAAGCCMMESFYQSVRCPLQILIVGEPLARPWGAGGRLVLDGIEESRGTTGLDIRARVESDSPGRFGRFLFLLDGKTAKRGTDASLEADCSGLTDGQHTLRAVAYGTGLVRHQVFAVARFEVRDGRIVDGAGDDEGDRE